MRKRPLFLWACVFLTGLALERYKTLELIGVLLFILGVEAFHGCKTKAYKKMAGRSIALLSAFFLGVFHMYTQECFREAYLSKIDDGEEVIVWGEISNIETTDYGIRVFLSDCYIHLEDEIFTCNDVLVYTSSSDYQVGQIHKISGKVNMFQQARNQGNFDSAFFYQSQKIDFAITASSFECLGYRGNWLQDRVLWFKEALKQVYSRCLSERTAGFYIGMILGDRSNLQEDLKETFTDGGIVHILAVSGLHMSIVGRGVYQFLRRCRVGFWGAGIVGAITLLLYCAMAGGGMSAMRAVGMMLLFFLAQCWGKSYDMLNALGGVGIVLLWENPFLLEYSGFWFSMMALAGIGFVTELFSWRTKLMAGPWSSLGITLAILPISAFCYYEVPLYSALINAVVLPLLTPVFVIALVGGILGILFPSAARVMLLPCHWCLVLFESVCAFANQLPGATLITGQPEKMQIVLYYGLLLMGLCMLRQLKEQTLLRRSKKEGLPLWWHGGKILLFVLCLGVLLFPKQQETEITFLDVGQGEGIYLCMPDKTHIFIDGGSTDVSEVGTYRILPFLKAKQVRSIDYWFVTHADSDHISGLLEALKAGYSVEYLVLAEDAPLDESLKELLSLAKGAGTEIIYMSEGDKVIDENWSMQCVYPGTEVIKDKNEASLVLLLEVDSGGGAVSALFTGDISSEAEQKLMESGLLDDISIYKVAHHGSKYSNSADFLLRIMPEVAVVSCSKNNSYGHPHTEVLERMEAIGCEIFQTKDSGQITIKIEKGIEVYVYIPPPTLIQ